MFLNIFWGVRWDYLLCILFSNAPWESIVNVKRKLSLRGGTVARQSRSKLLARFLISFGTGSAISKQGLLPLRHAQGFGSRRSQ